MFCRMYAIEHISTPPYNPRLNGQAEWFEDTIERALKKSRNEFVGDAALT